MQIGDCITFHPRAPFADSAEADLKTIRDTFVLTTETGEILARILPWACKKIIEELPEKMDRYGIQSLSQIIGRSHK
jgi:hypothetical protein